MCVAHGLTALVFAGAGLVACAPAPTVHTRSWYAVNAGERTVERAVCEQDSGLLASTPDCINAEAADADAHAARFYEAPKVAPRVQPSDQI